MNHTTALITEIQNLLKELAGTVYSESQTVIEINDLIGKVREEEDGLIKQIKDNAISSFGGFIQIYESDLRNIIKQQNPTNPS